VPGPMVGAPAWVEAPGVAVPAEASVRGVEWAALERAARDEAQARAASSDEAQAQALPVCGPAVVAPVEGREQAAEAKQTP
jgi:hypothetical protein